MKPLLGFLSVFLLGLVSGVSFSHLLQRGPKATLPGPQFLAVQQVLLRNYGRVIRGLEIAALCSTLAMSIVISGKPVVAPPCDPCLGLRPAHGDHLGRVVGRAPARTATCANSIAM